MAIKLSLKSETSSRFYPEYIFRITDGDNPLESGSWSKDNPLENVTDEVYISPCIYSWIGHYFKNEVDRIYAIKRPKTLTASTMCCGWNSHYHFIHTKHPELLKKMKEAVVKHDYSDKDLQRLFKEHEQRVMKRFGKKLSEMKGGEYLGTLGEFDSNHPKDAYPEIIISAAWKAGRGHVFNLAVLDGEVYLLDATANRIKLVEKSDYLKNKLDAKNSNGILRTDSGSVNAEMMKDTFSEDEKEFGFKEDEQKYISVTQALSKEGSEGKTFTIYRKGKRIGTVRCDSVAQTYGKDYKVWNYSWR